MIVQIQFIFGCQPSIVHVFKWPIFPTSVLCVDNVLETYSVQCLIPIYFLPHFYCLNFYPLALYVEWRLFFFSKLRLINVFYGRNFLQFDFCQFILLVTFLYCFQVQVMVLLSKLTPQSQLLQTGELLNFFFFFRLLIIM